MSSTKYIARERTVLSEFVAQHLFHKIETADGVVHWREVVGLSEGYVVIYPDGSHFHTYHFPPDWIDADIAEWKPPAGVKRGEVVNHRTITAAYYVTTLQGADQERVYQIANELGVPLAAVAQQEPVGAYNGNVIAWHAPCDHAGSLATESTTTNQVAHWCAKCRTSWTTYR